MQTLEEQRAHYRAVQQRILEAAERARAERRAKKLVEKLPPPPPPPPPPPLPVALPEVKPMPKLETFKPTYTKLLESVAEKHGLPVEALKSHCKTNKLAYARFEFFYIAREKLGLSWHGLGRKLGRDHTTALHGYRRFKEMIEKGEVSDPIAPSTVLGLGEDTEVGPGV